MSSFSKGPQGPRRSAQQTRAAQKQRDIMQQMKDDEMTRKMQEAYEKAQSQSVSGMKNGGKVRKFRLGGGTDDMGNKAGYEESPPDYEAPETFKEAFRRHRNAGEATFMWRGKKYTTELKKEAKESKASDKGETPASKGPSTRGGRRASAEKDEAPGRRFTGTYGETREALSSLSPEQKKDALAAGVGGAAMLAGGAGAAALRGAAAASRVGQVGVRGMTLAQREKDAAAAAEYAQRMKRLKDTAEARARMGRGAAYKQGGSVKKYARGGGIEIRGKTRGRFV